jgi:hypothetical protein
MDGYLISLIGTKTRRLFNINVSVQYKMGNETNGPFKNI